MGSDPWLMHHCSDDILAFVDFLLVLDPEQRPSAEEVLLHPYFRQEPLVWYPPYDKTKGVDIKQVNRQIYRDKNEKKREKVEDVVQNNDAGYIHPDRMVNHEVRKSKYEYRYVPPENVYPNGNGDDWNQYGTVNGWNHNDNYQQQQPQFNGMRDDYVVYGNGPNGANGGGHFDQYANSNVDVDHYNQV